ncbi:hypothetical protein B7R74_01380 [Yersinia pseudotuberculosis]|uniref:hypothetical protein n=1 Tax=Yersinia pseudotuberculosis complex TaxID=1649845 RepID=UPI00042659E1|nr:MULTISPECIES: hypothetical protein [Yersinia pseudotuberculosis complex]PSH23899.1 hypothetical protein B7R74_01380 [Yersinia pseudotuberculosis]
MTVYFLGPFTLGAVHHQGVIVFIPDILPGERVYLAAGGLFGKPLRVKELRRLSLMGCIMR